MTGAVPPARPVTPSSAVRPARSPSLGLSPERAALRKAAEGFEAIMVRKMLSTARAAISTEETPLTGGGLQQFQAMRDEHFADIAAQTGALGFARSIEAQLAQYLTMQGDS